MGVPLLTLSSFLRPMPATALLFLACGVVIGTGLAALIAFLCPVPAA